MEGESHSLAVRTRLDDSYGWWLAAGCFLLVFGVSYRLALHLQQMGVFAQYNVMFDADAVARLNCFATGWGGDCRSLVHPNLANLVNPPVRVMAAVMDHLGIGGVSQDDTRRSVALCVSPAAAGLQAVMLLALFRRLGFGATTALLLALLGGFSFSQLVFGSVPEHFALSGMGLSAALLLAADLAVHGRIRWWGWLAVGTFVTGVTIVNAVPVALAFVAGASVAGVPWRRILSAGARLCAMVALLSAMIAMGFNQMYDDSFSLGVAGGESSARHEGTFSNWVRTYFVGDAAAKAEGFPSAVGFAIAAPGVGLVDNSLSKTDGGRYKHQFTVANAHDRLESVLGAALAMGAMVGAIMAFRRGGAYRALALAGLGMLLFNWILHAFWGVEYFLYSQHWNVATVVLLSALVVPPASRFGTALLGLLVTVVAFNNALRIEEMLSILS